MHAQLLTRQQAVDALLSPSSGVPVFTNLVAVWSPFADFGSGPGREGLLPAGSAVNPRFLGVQPNPGPGMSVSVASYFFWIDDVIAANFMHATRFVLLRADLDNPTVDNGGIMVSEQGWWPVVTLPDTSSIEFFASDLQRVTANPPGFANPEGLVAGVAPHPSHFTGVSPFAGPVRLLSVLAAATAASNNAAGLIINGATNAHFASNVTQYTHDLTNHYGVSNNRVIIPNSGQPASTNQIAAAISNLCALDPPPSKIFIRVCSHGGVDAIQLGPDIVSGAAFCRLMREIAGKGVPVCMLIDACHAASLVDANRWGFPTGSVVIVSADSNRTSWGGAFVEMTGSVYSDAFSKCLNNTNADSNGNGVDDLEAHRWVTNQNPGYRPVGLQTNLGGLSFSNVTVHPAGNSSGWPTNLPPGASGVTNTFPNPIPRAYEQSLPRLNIQQSLGQIVLSWPTDPPGFQLEQSTNLSDPLWKLVLQDPVMEENRYTLHLLSTQPFSFFRLRATPLEDTEPPVLVRAFVEDPFVVVAEFSEPLEPGSASQTQNYQLFSEFPAPRVEFAQPQPDGATVLLFLEQPLLANTQYGLIVNRVTDLAGNEIAPNSLVTFNTPGP